MSDEQLKTICDLVYRLTELRQRECGHLCIENYAPELPGKLIRAAEPQEYGT